MNSRRRKRQRTRDERLVVGYVRVSTAEQHLGPDAQEAAIREFCERRDLQLIAVYRDLGLSGTLPIEKRKGLSQALEGADLAGASALVVARWDRLSRDAEQAKFLTRMFESIDIKILSADGVGNGDTPSDRFVRGVLSEVAAYERAITAARTRAALASLKARGYRVGNVPYGYRADAEGRLHPFPAEQLVIDQIRAWAGEGRAVRWIVRKLNELGVPARPRNQKGPPGRWQFRTVQRLIKEESSSC